MSKDLLEEAAKMITRLANRLEEKMKEVADLKAIIVDDTILVQRSAARIEALEAALREIMKATVEGRVCDDVAWFDSITTLHDYCALTLAPEQDR